MCVRIISITSSVIYRVYDSQLNIWNQRERDGETIFVKLKKKVRNRQVD